jgi:hypothetical protein
MANTTLLILNSRFSDRDLMMRFRGGGVGHKSTREATDFFKKDRDPMDARAPTSGDTSTRDDIGIDEELGAEDLEERHDEAEDSEIDEDIEDDYGYMREESDAENSDGAAVGDLDAASDDFGPEDDGWGVDPDMEELGYADF